MRITTNVITGAVEVDENWAPPAPPPPTEGDVKRERDRRMKALAAGYTETERETWPTQVAEATVILANPDAPAPLLTPLAQASGRTITEMAQRVLGLSQAFAAGTGAIMAAANTIRAMDPIPSDYTDDKYWVDVPEG
ncbi:hypothetical protein HKCCE4037_06360 [Rhodobacterales bacterium HKCCE4037]|nr:hypothetical protein [Rhodobacterales bacterium HKCCE4037]